jgi:hypothetical protein
LFGSLKKPSKEPHDRVLCRRDDLMDLGRDQTCAVEEILGDLRADPERHLGVLHHSDQHLSCVVGGHDQSLGGAPPDLGRSAAVLVADHSAVLRSPLRFVIAYFPPKMMLMVLRLYWKPVGHVRREEDLLTRTRARNPP